MQELKNELKKVLSEIVYEYRNKQNKSITTISNEIGLPKSIWSDLEKGIKDPQLTTIWKIAEALNIPLSQLIKDIENRISKDFSFIEKS